MSPKKITRPLDVYVRVSRVAGREGDSFISPEVQEEKCRALAKARGLKVGQVFTDLDRSGGKMNRPEFEKALARIESGLSGGLIVARIDRFARTLLGGLQSIESIEKNGGVVLTADGEFDTSTATGELVLRIMLSLAAFELRRISEQWEDAKARARARGIHIGAARAGYVRQADGTLAEHPEHIEAVKQAFALRARGGSWSETADVLNAAGVPTSKDVARAKKENREVVPSFWSRQAVHLLIRNRNYRAPAGPIPAWQWDKAQAKKGAPRVRGEGHVLGQGLCKCELCGDSMFRTANGRGTEMLRCGRVGKGHAAMKYETALDYITSTAFSRVGPALRERASDEEGKALRQAVEDARDALAAVEEQAGIKLPGGPLVEAVQEAEAALAEWQARIDAPFGLGDVLTPAGVRAEFEKLPIPEQRHILRQIISKVTISPGRGNPGDRIRVEFVDGTVYGEHDWSDPALNPAAANPELAA